MSMGSAIATAAVISGVAGVGEAAIGAHAASSAANQQKQAGQAAAQSFSPYQQGGNAAFNKALGMYGIAPVANAQQVAAAMTQPTPTQGVPGFGNIPAFKAYAEQQANRPIVPLPVTQPIVDEPGLWQYGVKAGSSYAG